MSELEAGAAKVVAEVKKQPLLSGILLLFILAMILANLGGNMYGPLMSLYVKDLGATMGQLGQFLTFVSAFGLLLQILGGWLSDRLGRLRAIAIGSVVGIFTWVALIWAPTWQWLLVAEFFSAITRSLIGPSFDAFVAEHSSEQNRARVFGITQTLFAVVGVVGPVLGGWLAQEKGFKFMLMVGGALYVMATILRVGMAREAARSGKSEPKELTLSSLGGNLKAMALMFLAGGVLTWILITDGVRDISFALSMNFLSVFMSDFGKLSLTQIGLTSSIFGLFMMLTMIPAGWLADKAGERVGISLGFLMIGISIGGIVFLPAADFVWLSLGAVQFNGVWLYGIGWAIAGIGVGLMTPAYQSLISKAVPQHLRGTAFGLFSSSIGLVSLFAPLAGAWLWDAVNPRFPFVITAVVSVLSIIPAWFKFRLPDKKEEEAVDPA
jgi:MFS family permease